MRIIAGEWRGRALTSVGKGDAAAHLRPTTDRVRESLFNVLTGGRFGDPLEGAQVLDVFAGTGALGLEALSRGATGATFIEDGRKSLAILQKNIKLLGADARILRCDARRVPDGTPHDLIFLDPPYGKALGEQAMDTLLAKGWVAPDALIVWEESGDITPPDGLHLLDSRSYGGTQIHLLEPQ